MPAKKKSSSRSPKVPALAKPVRPNDKTPSTVGNLLDQLEGKLKVIHGANDDAFDGLVGQKVSAVRNALAYAFNIPPEASVLVNGQPVGEDYTLKVDDVLEFIKQQPM